MDNNETIFENLEKAIIKIVDKNNNELCFNTIKIVKEKSYSLHVNNSIHVYVDGKKLIYLRKYKVFWKCRCNVINETLLVKYIYKSKLSCKHCCQSKEFDELGNNNPKRIKNEQILRQNRSFEEESNDFKQNYYLSHFTHDEFINNVLPHVQTISGINISNFDITQIKLLEHEKTNNQVKYVLKILYNNIEYPLNLTFKCDCCGKEFKKHLSNCKSLDKYLCRECIFTNKTWSIKLNKDLNIVYLSNDELKFIEKCKQYNITVERGPKLKYYFNSKPKIYNVDFYLPDFSYLVEIKVNHIFYRNDVKSGKQQAKNEVGENYAKDNNMKFKLLFQDLFEDFFKELNLLNEIV